MVPIPIISHEWKLANNDSIHPVIHILDHVTCWNEMLKVLKLHWKFLCHSFGFCCFVADLNICQQLAFPPFWASPRLSASVAPHAIVSFRSTSHPIFWKAIRSSSVGKSSLFALMVSFLNFFNSFKSSKVAEPFLRGLLMTNPLRTRSCTRAESSVGRRASRWQSERSKYLRFVNLPISFESNSRLWHSLRSKITKLIWLPMNPGSSVILENPWRLRNLKPLLFFNPSKNSTLSTSIWGLTNPGQLPRQTTLASLIFENQSTAVGSLICSAFLTFFFINHANSRSGKAH